MKSIEKSKLVEKLNSIEKKIVCCEDLNEVLLYYKSNGKLTEEIINTTEGQIVLLYIKLVNICKKNGWM